MSLFFVVSLSDPSKVMAAAKLIAADESDIQVVTPGEIDKFFMVFNGTSIDLSTKLGLADGASGTGIVLAVTGYHGRAPKSMWEWMTQKLAAK